MFQASYFIPSRPNLASHVSQRHHVQVTSESSMPQNVGAFKLDRADKLVVGTSGLTVVKGKRLGCPCGT